MKKLLLYANYYYPEIASLAQLYTDLSEGLKNKYEITVICAVPCYTGKIEDRYLTQKYYYENYNGINVIRVKVSRFDKGNKISRVKHILSYFINSIGATAKAPRVDYIMTGSQPPILGGLLGVYGKYYNRLHGKKTKLLYNIQDYNPEQTIVVGYSKNKLVLQLMMLFDKFSCKKADKVIVVGRDMVNTMDKRFAKKDGSVSKKRPQTVFINNWMNEKEVFPLTRDNDKVKAFKERYGLKNKFVIMYSGNIGLFYDLNNIIKVIERFKNNQEVIFPIVGDGTLKKELMKYVEDNDINNIVFIPYQSKEELIYGLNAADVHWVINAEGVKGVSCPSKLYGVLAVGKPVLAVLEKGSEARDIVETAECGYTVSPKDYDGIEVLINRFIDKKDSMELAVMGENGYKYMLSHLTREISIQKYYNEIESC